MFELFSAKSNQLGSAPDLIPTKETFTFCAAD